MAVISIKRKNKSGDALAGLPGKMNTPTAADGGTGTTATVTFSSISAATSYTVLSSGAQTATGTSSPITVSGLTSGTSYTFQVRAINSQGTGAYSESSNAVTPLLPGMFDSIATATPSGTNIVTFNSIPATYKHLHIRLFGRSVDANDSFEYELYVNGYNSNSYTFHGFYVNNANTSFNYWNAVGSGTTRINNGMIGTSNSNTNAFGFATVDIFDYADTTKYKTFMMNGGSMAASGTTYDVGPSSGTYYNNLNAISSISISSPVGNFASGTNIGLFGIKDS